MRTIRNHQQITFLTLNRFYIVCQVLKIHLIKAYKAQSPRSFIFYCFTLASTSADIIFDNFSELCSILSEKIFHVTLSFFNRLTQIPHPLNRQNLLSVIKDFCQCSLIVMIMLIILRLKRKNGI